MGIIYKAENLLTGKVYIGQTECTLEERIKNHYNQMHKSMMSTDVECNYESFAFELHNYEKETFIWDIIDRVSITSELNEREIYWISYYNATDEDFGYNKSAGGQGRRTPMYYDGSTSLSGFYNNNATREENSTKYREMVGGQTRSVKCNHCSKTIDIKIDIIGTPTRDFFKCPKCKEFVYENFTDYFNKFKRS